MGNRSSGLLTSAEQPHRLVDGFTGSTDAADNLTGVFSIPGVNVDQVLGFEEYLVTKFTRPVVIHGADQMTSSELVTHLPVLFWGSDPYT